MAEKKEKEKKVKEKKVKEKKQKKAAAETAAVSAPAEKKLSRKERKRLKKETRKKQLELEKQLVNEGKIPPRNKYKANGFFWRVFSICLAFFFGIFGAVGAFLAFGAFAPVEVVFGFFNQDASKLFSEKYTKESIFDLVGDLMNDIGDGNLNSLGALTKYTPRLDDYLEEFQTSLSDMGVHVELEDIKTTTFGNLGSYFRDNVIDGIVLGEVLGLKPGDDGLVLGICYGKEGTDYTVQDGKIVPINPPLTIGDLTAEDGTQSVIKKITIEQALGVTAESNAAMRFLAYGTEGTDYKIEDGKVVMLKNELTGKPYEKKTLADLTSTGATPIENARISDLITVEGDTGILAAIRDWKISDLQDTYRIERLKINQVMDIGADASKIAQAIADWRLGDLTDAAKMDSLTLGDVIDIDESSPRILHSLEDTPIGEFGDAIDGLRLEDILTEEDFEGNNFLKTLRMSSLTTLSQDLKNLSAADVFGEEMYSYLDPTEQHEQKNYAELYEFYRTEGYSDKEKSEVAPVPKELGENDSVHAYFVPKAAGSTRLTAGYYAGEAGSYTAVDAKNVHMVRSGDPGGESITYYMTGEQRLTEHRIWKVVDYENKQLTALPEGDSISADTAGYKVREVGSGTPFTDGTDAPLYYLTTRDKFVDGAPTSEKENIAYPLFENAYGVYYTYLNYTPGTDGPDEFREERVDLDYALDALSYEKDGAAVTLRKDENGDWKEDKEDGAVVSVYEKKAVKDEGGDVTEPGYYYIKTKEDVHYGYYAESGEIDRVYGEAEVTEKFEIVTTVEGAVQTTVPVDRYLSGVWFFLFGTDEEGNLTDNSHMPVLDLTDVMTGMADSLSNTELWQLFFHGLLTKNPFVDLSTVYRDGVEIGAKTVKNLNECTVVECVDLVQHLVSAVHISP